MKVLFKIISILSFITLIGCDAKIKYSLSDIEPLSEQSMKNISISINPFKDRSRKNIGAEQCYNDRKGYGKTKPGLEVSRMLCDHLNEMGFFKECLFNTSGSTDYYLTATLKYFVISLDVNQQAIENAEKGAAFSVFGAAAALAGGLVAKGANSKLESTIRYKIGYTDIKLFNKKNKCILTLADYITNKNEIIKAQTTCSASFGIINKKLLQHNNDFIEDYLPHFIDAIKKDQLNATFVNTNSVKKI